MKSLLSTPKRSSKLRSPSLEFSFGPEAELETPTFTLINYTPYFRSRRSPAVSDQENYNIRYPDRCRGNQHNNIAAGAMTTRDKHRPCQDGMFSVRHDVQNKNPSLSCAQRWMRHEGTSVQQYACNYTRKLSQQKTKLCDLVTRREFSCLQEISKLSRSVLNNCLAVQNKSIRAAANSHL